MNTIKTALLDAFSQLLTAFRSIENYIQSAMVAVLNWLLNNILAPPIIALFQHLPAIPPIDWTPLNNCIGYAEAFFPLATLFNALTLYFAWIIAWSTGRIVAKLIWSG